MTPDLTSPSVGLDRNTGSIITGWDHVMQSMWDFFTTAFAERLMREWYGSLVPGLLGKNITVAEVTPFFTAMSAAIEQWEPRYRVAVIQVLEATRLGKFGFYIDGAYRPRAVYGDFTVEGARRVYVTLSGSTVAVGAAP
jgi:phage baseplate assembly protein W